MQHVGHGHHVLTYEVMYEEQEKLQKADAKQIEHEVKSRPLQRMVASFDVEGKRSEYLEHKK